jgi:hypothetical protein
VVISRSRGSINLVGGASRLLRPRKRGVFDPSPTCKPRDPLSRRTQSEIAAFTWTADPDEIIAAVRRGHQALDSIH